MNYLQRYRYLFALLLAATCGCVSDNQIKTAPTDLAKGEIALFYATDRNIENENKSNFEYGEKRGSAVSFGICQVVIDIKKDAARRKSLWYFKPHVYNHIKDLKKIDKHQFLSAVRRKLATGKNKKILIFIHGYNESFDDAAKKFAQIVYSLKFDGLPIFFSWASRDKLNGYFADEATIKWSKVNIKNFIKDLLYADSSSQIYLVAHSMGNRGMTRAFNDIISDDPLLATRFKALIMAAPDIDSEVFKVDIAPKMLAARVPVVLYVSTKDLAMSSSASLKTTYQRLGDGHHPVIIAGIDTIDISLVSRKILGHNYIFNNQAVIEDLAEVINRGTPPESRSCLKPAKTAEGPYWKMEK